MLAAGGEGGKVECAAITGDFGHADEPSGAFEGNGLSRSKVFELEVPLAVGHTLKQQAATVDVGANGFPFLFNVLQKRIQVRGGFWLGGSRGGTCRRTLRMNFSNKDWCAA
jgi:hypothetical protein